MIERIIMAYAYSVIALGLTLAIGIYVSAIMHIYW